jgi:hypothetical protein
MSTVEALLVISPLSLARCHWEERGDFFPRVPDPAGGNHQDSGKQCVPQQGHPTLLNPLTGLSSRRGSRDAPIGSSWR